MTLSAIAVTYGTSARYRSFCYGLVGTHCWHLNWVGVVRGESRGGPLEGLLVWVSWNHWVKEGGLRGLRGRDR